MTADSLLYLLLLLMVVFFKQKTAYEMRISDWSSDVCSSDLLLAEACIFSLPDPTMGERIGLAYVPRGGGDVGIGEVADYLREKDLAVFKQIGRASCRERCVSTCRSRWSPYH